MLAMNFADKLNALLDLKRWPQQRLRELLSDKPGQTTVHNWCSNKGPLPRLDQAYELARAFGVSMEWLADDSADMPPTPAASEEGLTEDEKLVLRLVRTMGSEQALRRLAALEIRPLSAEQADQLKRELGR